MRVTNVTDTSADVVLDYTFDRQSFQKTTGVDPSFITNVGFVTRVQKIVSMTPAETWYQPMSAGCSPVWTDADDVCTNVTKEDQAKNISGLRTEPLKVWDHTIGTMSGYDFHSVTTLNASTELKDKGTVTIPIRNLQPQTWYGNKNVPQKDESKSIYPMSLGSEANWYLNVEKMREVGQTGALSETPGKCTETSEGSYTCSGGETYGTNKNYGTPINVDMNQLFVGAHIGVNVMGQCGDANTFSVYQDAVQVPAFTTAATGSAQTVSFRDVSPRTPHANDITWLAQSKISEGWKEKDGTVTFRPMNSVVRQDMAAFLRRLAVKDNIADAATWKPSAADWNKFTDVKKNTPHAEDVLWLAHAGISTGWREKNGTYTFRPMNTVVRQDMAAFLKRLADKAGKSGGVTPKTDFTDVNSRTPHVAEIQWLGGSSISTGYRNPNGSWRFEGMTSVYRQDMAAFLHRLDTLLTK
ncbi:MAG: S-layer homology domain-containing protein [Bifidobacterium sp.]|nr:S-layer homology domain-containing protein [Bifidobacterium sp.]